MSNLIHEALPPPNKHLSEASEKAHHLKAQQVAERDIAMKDLSSLQLTPEARVRRWEQVHGAKLPPSARHPVLRVIADVTGLTLAEVQTVQRERAG
jgi:hypothetical protein